MDTVITASNGCPNQCLSVMTMGSLATQSSNEQLTLENHGRASSYARGYGATSGLLLHF